MLNPEAITAFLVRKVQSYEWLKGHPVAELDSALSEYLPGLPNLNLWRHQKVALVLLAELKRFMLHIDMGGGKTLTTLALIEALKRQGQRPKAIVFVPYVTSVMTWVDECKKHTPGLTCIPLVSDTSDNARLINDIDGDLFVICYQSAVAMLADKQGKKWRLPAGHVREVFADFNILVMDEVHKCKDVTSLTYKMCLTISKQVEYALGLTGTPFGRDLQDLWPQFNLIDFGATLGPTMGFYREVFFRQKKCYWGGYDYLFRKKLLPDLKRIIKNRSIHYSIDELIDLPPKEYVKQVIRCPEAAKSYADAAMLALRAACKDGTHHVVESNYLQLRQLSSGYMTVVGEEDRIQIEFDDNPKLEALVGLIEALPPGCKMVVFHHFVYTNALISKRLDTLKVAHARVWGDNNKNLEELERFKSDPNCTILVINTRSGSSSLNLQFANYCVFFEQPDSPIDRQQAERRVWRPGQVQRVWYYDLLVGNTVDKKMNESNIAGKNLLQEILKGDVSCLNLI